MNNAKFEMQNGGSTRRVVKRSLAGARFDPFTIHFPLCDRSSP
jgi:hypothetical protein